MLRGHGEFLRRAPAMDVAAEADVQRTGAAVWAGVSALGLSLVVLEAKGVIPNSDAVAIPSDIVTAFGLIKTAYHGVRYGSTSSRLAQMQAEIESTWTDAPAEPS